MYKQSRYNYIVNYNNKTIYFNGISGAIFAMSNEEHSRLSVLWNDLISFQIQYASLFAKFEKMGFFVDENVNEINLILCNNKKEVFVNKNYSLVILPTIECNFNCWYCYQQHKPGSMTLETMDRLKKHIERMVQVEKVTSLSLSWFGGEPLLYFNEVVYPISLFAKEISEKNNIPFHNSVTTNGYLINEEMIGYMKHIDLNMFQITLDGDEAKHDKVRNVNGKPTYRRIIDNILLLCKEMTDLDITLRLNYDDKTLSSKNIKSLFEEIPFSCRKYITIDFQQVWQIGALKNESVYSGALQNILQECKEMSYKSIVPRSKFSLGKNVRCYADRYYSSVINYDGVVHKCTAIDYNKDNILGKLLDDGDIEWNKQKQYLMYSRSNFENTNCLNCKHVPICMGPCLKELLSDTKISDSCEKEHDSKITDFIVDVYGNLQHYINQKKKEQLC